MAQAALQARNCLGAAAAGLSFLYRAELFASLRYEQLVRAFCWENSFRHRHGRPRRVPRGRPDNLSPVVTKAEPTDPRIKRYLLGVPPSAGFPCRRRTRAPPPGQRALGLHISSKRKSGLASGEELRTMARSTVANLSQVAGISPPPAPTTPPSNSSENRPFK